ncbi:MAG: hypothetical protein M1541_10495 [Acidobacteria bacterium]|nr:hypothetical protein [Acidobacteriota bacterium]
MRRAQPGCLAFLTTRRPDDGEDDRIVIAAYEIAAVEPFEDWGFVVKSVPSSRCRVKDLSAAPRFWKFHSQTAGPRWNTGLFRYLPDSEAKRLYEAVLNLAG